MSMQVHEPFEFILIFKGTKNTVTLNYFERAGRISSGTMNIHLMCYNYGSPIGFKLTKLTISTDSAKLINWLQTDFKKLFAYDPLLWLASVATVPVELHQYLIPFHKDTYDNAIS